jgi:AcrR family transcriptional regulator
LAPLHDDRPAAMSPRGVHETAQRRGLPRGRKSTQRERLIASVVATVDRSGYTSTNVSKIITEAGVSRPTFYDYFSDREDCFLGALRDIHERLMLRVRRSVEQAPPQLALQTSLATIVEFACAEPTEARFLISQSMGAGPRALDVRDAGIAEIEQLIYGAHARASPTTPIPAIRPRILIGGVYRLLASRLRRGEPGLLRIIDDLVAWVESYVCSEGERRWQRLIAIHVGSPPPRSALRPPPVRRPLPPDTPGLSREQAVAEQRQRILFAAAELAEQQGYNATTIADITRLAGVDGRTFYAAFADKQDVFMAVHEVGVKQVMSATASAFFTGVSWPERMWAAGQAFAGFLESNPLFAHVGFVEAYAVGPGAVQRVEDSHVTFTIFLQEGYQQQSMRTPPSRLALEAIITSIFEIVYREARSRQQPHVSGMLGAMAFLALAPFLGAKEANRFIDRQLAA